MFHRLLYFIRKLSLGVFVLIFVSNFTYAATGNPTDKKSGNDALVAKAGIWLKGSIGRLIGLYAIADVGERYSQALTMVEELFDYRHMIRFGIGAKRIDGLDQDAREELDIYAKRWVALLLSEKFMIRDASFNIVKSSAAGGIVEIEVEIEKIDGLDVKNLAAGMESGEGMDGIGLISFRITPKKNGFVLQDIKTMRLSFLMTIRDRYQKLIQENGDNVGYAIGDMIRDLERRESLFSRSKGVDPKLFPPIRPAMTLD